MPGQDSETLVQSLWPRALLDAVHARDLRRRTDWAHLGIMATSPGFGYIVGLDTSVTADGHAREAYLDAIGHSADTVFLTEPATGRVAVTYLGAACLSNIEMSPLRSERTVALIEQDRADVVSILHVVTGGGSGLAGGRRVAYADGTTILLDYSQPFLLVDDRASTSVSLTVPRAMFTARLGEPRDVHGVVVAPQQGALLGAYLRALAAQMTTLPPPPAADRLADVALDLLAVALDRSALPAAVKRLDRREALAERARRVIEERLGAPDLTPELLMARLSVSRSDLYSLFEDVGGVSRYIWRRRLDAARTALLDPTDRRRIGEIAFACGFSSEAHFSRAFRQQFGLTPSAARQSGKL